MLLIHEGGAQSAPPAPIDPSGCANFAGAITADRGRACDPEYGLVVSGHTHRFYICALPNSAGTTSLVTSAGTNGQLVTDITVTLDKSSDDVHRPQRDAT